MWGRVRLKKPPETRRNRAPPFDLERQARRIPYIYRADKKPLRVREKSILIIGALYDLDSGKVEFFE